MVADIRYSKYSSLRILVTVTLLPLFAIVLMIAGLYVTAPKISNLPALKDGDIIFRSGLRQQAIAIFIASANPYTHMGIIKIEKGDVPFVIEAVGPVKKTPLQAWINTGFGRRITIKRIDDLSRDKALDVIESAEKYYGRPYDVYFVNGTDALYCSELVNIAYQDGANINLGQVQKLKDLNVNNPAVSRLIKQRWEKYPQCRAKGLRTLEACLPLIYDQELITPASIANDSQLTLVYSNYGYLE